MKVKPFMSYNDFFLKVISTSATYTALTSDEVVLGTGGTGGITVNLPSAVGRKGKYYIVKKIDAGVGAVTLDPYSTQTVDGASTLALTTQNNIAYIISDGSNWLVVSKIVG